LSRDKTSKDGRRTKGANFFRMLTKGGSCSKIKRVETELKTFLKDKARRNQ
jgi:hypothetical protein